MLVHVNSDHWKSELHQRLAMPSDAEGASVLYEGVDKFEHEDFANHLTAEKQVDKNGEIFWERISRENHWLDSSYGAQAAAWFVRELVGKQPNKKRMSLAELAKRAG